MTDFVLEPILPQSAPPCWPQATWIGQVDRNVALPDHVGLAGSIGYDRARLLIRAGTSVCGFVETAIFSGAVYGPALRAQIDALPRCNGKSVAHAAVVNAPITVVVCTRNRVDQLRTALESILDLDYENFDVVIVDNSSDDDSTADYVRELGDPRVTVVKEPVPGLANARNRGVRVATGELVAFTDDDVVVDRFWLQALAASFASAPEVGCVSGLVPSAELRTATQAYFEERVQWSDSLDRQLFDIDSPPAGNVLFPFQVGIYGTGANFAVRRQTCLAVGGFDERLGVGSPTGGGEDIDFFVRVIVSGAVLIYEPDAVVWHRHRDDERALLVQARGYGLGLGAWLTKVALDPALRPIAMRRFRPALRHLFRITESDRAHAVAKPPMIRRVEVAAILRGPLAYNRSRRDGRNGPPLYESDFRNAGVRR